jgi:hypothetical protein
MIFAAIAKYIKGMPPLLAKNKVDQSLISRVEAVDDPCHTNAHFLSPQGTVDIGSISTVTEKSATIETK